MRPYRIRRIRLIIASVILIPSLPLVTGCSHRPAGMALADSPLDGNGDRAGAVDTTEFASALARHSALPAAEQEAIRQAAEDKAAVWRDFEREAFRERDSRLRHWYYRDDVMSTEFFGVGVGAGIADLKDATLIDPSFAEAWGHLGRLCSEVGDVNSGRKYLERALVAAETEADAGRSLALDQQLEIYRDLAWAYRDLALWERGLAMTNAGLQMQPGDPELVLIKGLLLAGDGQFTEAISLAVRMEPLAYPQYDFLHRGFQHQTSGYANRWIKSQAFLSVGDVDQAYHVLGDLATYSYRSLLLFSSRYWRDAALVAELHGDANAPTYYAVGHVTRDYLRFYPAMSHSVASQVLDVPDGKVPVYTSFGPRFYTGGSPLSYVGLQINLMAQGLFAEQNSQAAGRALQMLAILEKRNVRPDVCRALRGRIYFSNDDFELARVELSAARAAFDAQGKIDGGTSLLLGLLHLQVEDHGTARELLNETVTVDPDNAVAWRSLGVVNVQLGDVDTARLAMDRAVALDPWTVTSYYNRGLLHLQLKEFVLARADLERAYRLDPENREVQRLLQVAAAASSAQDPAQRMAVSSDESPPSGNEADPVRLLAQLEAEVEAILVLPDSLRTVDPAADARFSELESRYAVSADCQLRTVLALGYIDRRQYHAAQAILEPGWGLNLTPDEELMLLYVDRHLGEVARAEQVVQRVMGSGQGFGNPHALAIAVNSMRTGVDPVREDLANFRNITTHGFYYWWMDASRNFGRTFSGRATAVGDFTLYRKYINDPLFEQAVWGMMDTPIQGNDVGVAGSGRK